jgi:hypothetical protein
MLTIEIDSSPFAYKCKGVMNYIEENSSFHVGPQKNDEVDEPAREIMEKSSVHSGKSRTVTKK